MYSQILYWLFIAGVLIETTRSQNVTESEDEDTPLHNVTSNNVVCEQPDLPEVVLLEPIPRHGPFPGAELTKLLKDKAVYAEYCQTKRLPTYCSKKNTPTGEPGPGPGLDVCQAETKVMEIPKFVSYNNMKCWVLHHWHSYCQYATCKWRTCRGVTPNSQTQTKCVQTNFKHIYYYIICPNPWKLYKRYVTLPQCCSCHLFKC